MTTNDKDKRTLADYLGIAARGYAMGAAEIVPGVSGGTMAFILGIYEELIDSIRGIANKDLIKALLGFKIKEVFDHLNWKFLGAVAVGMFAAIFTLASLLENLLNTYPVFVWSFFFGLIIASVVVVSGRVEKWGIPTGLAVLLGAVGAYFLVGAIPAQTPETWWFLLLSGAVAICAMILPGVSGSFVLVLLGKYQYVLAAVGNLDIVTLGLVAVGAGIGLVTFAQLLGWLFKNYHNLTVATLTGLMIGSLRKIWPWKEVLETMIDRHGEEVPIRTQNILPQFTVNGAFNTEILFAVGLMLVAVALVIVLERLGNQKPEHGDAVEEPAEATA